MNKKNLANAQLLNAIDTSATTITVKQNQGEALPATPFFATLTPLGVLSTIDNSEIVQVTARTGDVLTVTRAQRGTTAKEFQAESILANSVYVEDTVPAGGTNGQVLKRDASGNAIWSTDTNTTYTEITEAEIDAGTSSTLRTITGRRWTYMFDSVKAWVNTAISTAIGQNVYPVGSLYFNADNPDNPGTLLGFGTWEPYAEGRVPVGKAASGTFSTAGATMGAETHTLTIAEMPSHNHGVSQTGTFGTSGNAEYYLSNNQNLSGGKKTGPAGGGKAHNNIQPSVVVYIWRRTA